MTESNALLVGLLIGLLATPLVAVVARAIRLVDPTPGSVRMERKTQARPVPVVGGILLFAVGCLAMWLEVKASDDHHAGLAMYIYLPIFGGLVLIGLVDDWFPKGLSPLSKLALPVLPFMFVFLLFGGQLDIWELAKGALLFVVVANLVNTFDHADGACHALGIAGLAGSPWIASRVFAGALAGILPWNLARFRGASMAYLGDGGSYATAAWLLTGGGWPVLAVPAVDLARLSIERLARGSRPWIGDREHLFHLLERAGFNRFACVAIAAVLLAPAALTRDWVGASISGVETAVLLVALKLHQRSGFPDKASG